MLKSNLLLFFCILLFSSTADSYIGPGVAGGFILSLIGVLIAIIAAIFSIFYFPIKKFLNRKKKIKK